MRNFKISSRQIKKEGAIFLVSLLASFGLNIYSVYKSETEWTASVDQIPMIVIVAGLIYILVVIFRLIFILFERLTKSK